MVFPRVLGRQIGNNLLTVCYLNIKVTLGGLGV
jgi:hypothetical protein